MNKYFDVNILDDITYTLYERMPTVIHYNIIASIYIKLIIIAIIDVSNRTRHTISNSGKYRLG